MAKQQSFYHCQNCDFKTIKWLGQCPECKEWNTLEQGAVSAVTPQAQKIAHSRIIPMKKLADVQTTSHKRMICGINEWDRVTGGGLMLGSFIILTGDPGIGKSTLMLQVAYHLAHNYNVLYFSSEESLEQVKQRAERLSCIHEKLLFSDQANLDEVIATTLSHKPHLIIIDSIQNCYSSDTQALPGSIGQLKESAFRLMRLAKENMITVMLSGHITKDGFMAGPKTLEHMVDAVFYLQGEDRWQTRVLRSVKNRFGTVNEIGFFEMDASGLQEVGNINQHLLEEVSHSPGSVLVSHLEGTRPILLELQALTIASKFGMPQRVVSGLESAQVVLIAAILEKYLKVKLSGQDIFFKVSGGFKIKGSSLDLGIALALLSSYFQKPLPEKCIALGELSLTGQIKPINHIGQHISEIEKFGITKLFTARNQKLPSTSIKLHTLSNVFQLLELFNE